MRLWGGVAMPGYLLVNTGGPGALSHSWSDPLENCAKLSSGELSWEIKSPYTIYWKEHAKLDGTADGMLNEPHIAWPWQVATFPSTTSQWLIATVLHLATLSCDHLQTIRSLALPSYEQLHWRQWFRSWGTQSMHCSQWSTHLLEFNWLREATSHERGTVDFWAITLFQKPDRWNTPG